MFNYMPLKDYQKRTVVEYIWQDANGGFRSKTKIFPTVCWEDTIETTPLWNFDGSSTGQAETENSEVILKPWFKCMDPFRFLINKSNMYSQLIFCDLWVPKKDTDGQVVTKEGMGASVDGLKKQVEEEVANYLHPTDFSKREETVNSKMETVNGRQMELVPHRDNKREAARKLFEDSKVKEEDPWFGFEQEFFFTDLESGQILGFDGRYPEQQGVYYCGVGSNDIVEKVRKVADTVLNDVIVIRGHLNCTGYNLEVAPGQCEFQIRGSGLDAADNLTVFRYILTRRASEQGLGVTFHPKPVDNMGEESEWNGSGCHTNFSTKSMRSKNGYEKIIEAVDLLRQSHNSHMRVYGEDNELRMTGDCETANFNEFSWGVGDRTASVRIPQNVAVERCGYLEDRRPGANCDPYVVSSKMVETLVLKKKSEEVELVEDEVEVVEEDGVVVDENGLPVYEQDEVEVNNVVLSVTG